VLWEKAWKPHGGPVRITPAAAAPVGGCLATAAQTLNQLDVLYVGSDGAVYVTWVVGLGHWSDGTPGNPPPARITPPNFAMPGACITAGHQRLRPQAARKRKWRAFRATRSLSAEMSLG
jgi:hypothetical protein